MTEYKTLREWGVKEGDVVANTLSLTEHYTIRSRGGYLALYGENWGWGVFVADSVELYALISRATPAPKLWRDMTPAETGALLLAVHEGKVIEFFLDGAWHEADRPAWTEGTAYRVRPEPVVVDLLIPGEKKIGTINLIDGKPDAPSIRLLPL